MLSALVIVFREIIEAGLVVGIVLTATRGVPRRGLWIGSGVLAGAVAACLVALGAGWIAALFSGSGQELFNAGVLLLAVAMLAWHNIWMARHGRALAEDMRQVGADVAAGRKPMAMLALVCGLAVLREGSEVVLFLYSIAAAGHTPVAALAAGGALGLLAGAGLSALMYRGLLTLPARPPGTREHLRLLRTLPARHLFGVTSALITLLAAGLAAQATALVQQGGHLDVLSSTVWDSSWLLADDSLVGRLVHTLVGYTARPSGAQVAAYLATAAIIIGLARFRPRPVLVPAAKRPPRRQG